MTSVLPPFVQACSGAIGSVVANASSYPLDLVCTRLQLSEKKGKHGVNEAYHIIKRVVVESGLFGLYDGIETDTASTLLSNFLYFYVYSYLRTILVKQKFTKLPGKKSAVALSATEELCAGFLAGVSSRAVTTPLSIITVRLQNAKMHKDALPNVKGDEELSHDTSAWHVVNDIYSKDGLAGFWKGFETSALLCLNPSITLLFYQSFRRIFLRGMNRELPTPLQAFVGGAFANVLAVTILYPLILAKTRLQAARHQSEDRKYTMLGVWRAALSPDGPAGLYQGLEAQLLKGFLNQGLTMMTKQRLENLIIGLYLSSIARKRGT